ncbi:MAG: hypothetical protein J5525_12175 [Lachnospiraceae bacterium]|nr:hypothetical protein [Lachnospiraceae bacterium]
MEKILTKTGRIKAIEYIDYLQSLRDDVISNSSDTTYAPLIELSDIEGRLGVFPITDKDGRKYSCFKPKYSDNNYPDKQLVLYDKEDYIDMMFSLTMMGKRKVHMYLDELGKRHMFINAIRPQPVDYEAYLSQNYLKEMSREYPIDLVPDADPIILIYDEDFVRNLK